MKPPTTYAEWCACLDLLVANELNASDLKTLDEGILEWSQGSGQRYANRFSEAYDAALKQCNARFQKRLSYGMGDELNFIKALTSVRKTLSLLFQISLSEPIPESLRDHLQTVVNNYAERTQSSLENSAKSDRSGQAAYLLRNNSLLKFDRDKFKGEKSADGQSSQPIETTATRNSGNKKKRRVIL